MQETINVYGTKLNIQQFNTLLEYAQTRDPNIKLKRLKMATDAYKEYKQIHVEYPEDIVESPVCDDYQLTDSTDMWYKPWVQFRDEFLVDRELNYRLVDEKEAEVIFNETAENALNELDSMPDINTIVDDVETQTSDDVDSDPVVEMTQSDVSVESVVPTPAAVVVAPKRRGRPPGSGGKAKTVKTPKVSTTTRRAKRGPVTRKTVRKTVRKVAAKKRGGSNAERARSLIKSGVGRGWERKRIIEKLVNHLNIGSAYAASLYQSNK
jgi:hypothetical protein